MSADIIPFNGRQPTGYDLEHAPDAARVQVFVCEHCLHVHIALLDAHDRVLAYGSISEEDAESLRDEFTSAIGLARYRRGGEVPPRA